MRSHPRGTGDHEAHGTGAPVGGASPPLLHPHRPHHHRHCHRARSPPQHAPVHVPFIRDAWRCLHPRRAGGAHFHGAHCGSTLGGCLSVDGDLDQYPRPNSSIGTLPPTNIQLSVERSQCDGPLPSHGGGNAVWEDPPTSPLHHPSHRTVRIPRLYVKG